ncbi:prepilin-type N-terminal cleavage/methylation domain-containing protein [bacterium]|nr:prepilin-type N-terminal cleavage/methylation domain-containing protein [bacterium]
MVLHNFKNWIGRFLKRDSGFTLMELTVVMVCISFITIGIPLVVQMNVESYLQIRSGKHYVQAARIGFRQMTAELRQIERSDQINRGSSSRINFNLPSVGGVDYNYSSTYKELERGGDRFVFPVNAFRIRFFDNQGNTISSFSSPRNDIWRIEVRMVVGDDETHIVLWDQIHPRSFN